VQILPIEIPTWAIVLSTHFVLWVFCCLELGSVFKAKLCQLGINYCTTIGIWTSSICVNCCTTIGIWTGSVCVQPHNLFVRPLWLIMLWILSTSAPSVNSAWLLNSEILVALHSLSLNALQMQNYLSFLTQSPSLGPFVKASSTWSNLVDH